MNFRKIFLNPESFVFIASQMAAGFLNYLFLIYASQSLSVVDFGSWSQWLAQFSVACFVGVWLQSLSSISEIEKWVSLKISRIFLVLLIVCQAAAVSLHWNQFFYVLAWTGSLMAGLWFGVHLRQKKMILLAIATVLSVLFKFTWAFLDRGPNSFYHSTALAPTVACLAFMILSKLSLSVGNKISAPLNLQVMIASLSLAFFSAWVPQVDLLVAPRMLSNLELGLLAKVALIYKSFFFGFQILAQLLLSHQAQPGAQRLSGKHFAILGFLGMLGAGVSLAVASYLAWPLSWSVLGVLHITTLCLVYLSIQDFAARHHGNWAFGLCLLSLLMAGAGAFLQLQIENYWVLAISIEFVTVALLARRPFTKQDLS